jgi:hypothetical protein
MHPYNTLQSEMLLVRTDYAHHLPFQTEGQIRFENPLIP